MKLFQGEPLKPVVDRLMEQLSTNHGDVHQHNDIAHVAGCKYPSARYRSVVHAWRQALMKDKNIDLDSIHDVGYRVLSENERVSVGVSDFRRSVRQMGRSANRIASADTSKLDSLHRMQQDHAVRLSVELVNAGRKAAKQIATLAKIEVLPRPKAK